ncbi:MAG TPA: cobalamin-binding protein [Deltaproteobacteria bacterium]|nr:cobalamin-binding protein [Deltaproteobacteria bacterium]
MDSTEAGTEILRGLAEAVVAYDEEKTVELARMSLKQGIDPGVAILKGLAFGMDQVGKLYETQEYFVPELLLCADAMNAALDVLKPHIKVEAQAERHSVVIGTVEGDIHEIGKNLVKIMYEAAGWTVYDLGADVKAASFSEEQKRTGAEVVAMSCLMTTSMLAIPEVIKAIKANDPDITVMVGGAPLNRELAMAYGADGYAESCGSAVKETLTALNRVKGAT